MNKKQLKKHLILSIPYMLPLVWVVKFAPAWEQLNSMQKSQICWMQCQCPMSGRLWGKKRCFGRKRHRAWEKDLMQLFLAYL